MANRMRAQFEDALRAEIDRAGPDYSPMAAVREFAAKGVSQATLYRWAAAFKEHGAKAHLRDKVKEALERPVEETVEEAKAEIVGELERPMPPIALTPSAVVAAGGTISVIEHLQRCVRVAERILNEVEGEGDDPIRFKKTALAASEHLRRTMETFARIADAMMDQQRIAEFHQAIIAEVEKLAPETAELMRQAMLRVAARFR